jgi:hypothetical protein
MIHQIDFRQLMIWKYDLVFIVFFWIQYVILINIMDLIEQKLVNLLMDRFNLTLF